MFDIAREVNSAETRRGPKEDNANVISIPHVGPHTVLTEDISSLREILLSHKVELEVCDVSTKETTLPRASNAPEGVTQ